jgi:DNA (cytosine-5)-methyltransferase 1
MTIEPIFLIVDLFCGFGGTTTGFELAEIDGNKIAKVIACINHDPKAIKSHWMNHPDVIHFEEDIRTLDLYPLASCVEKWRTIYPNAKLILWASLECTNFSKAKGGMPRDGDSRTLAEHLFRYQKSIDPDYIMIENVIEFMSWGPLDEKGKPVSRKNGCDWIRWRNEMCQLGYTDEWQQLNSANFGAYTSRNRLFGAFAKQNLPIVWPEPTHSKKVVNGMFGELQPWQAVKNVLDFNDEGESIFNRKKKLSDNTLERIYAGLIKFIANGNTSFIAKYYSGRPEGKVISVNGPAGTIKTSDGQSLVQASFLLKYNSTNGNTGVHHPPSVDQPEPTIACQGRLGLVNGKFLSHYYGNGFSTDIAEPCPTLSTKDKASLIQAKSHYLLNPQFNNSGASIDKPCFTLIAKMDKKPPYLVEVEPGIFSIEIYETDSNITKKIKAFMAYYGLIDIKMRMLRVSELIKIQGFPSDYKMFGNQTDHKKFIGNSVVPIVVQRWAEALAKSIIHQNKKAA